MNPLVIFSDLDGTLLDHHTYSFDAALDTLNTLKRLHIPCVLNTSKTYAELITITDALELNAPFIIENGSAVYIPKQGKLQSKDQLDTLDGYYCKAFGPNRQAILELMKRLKSDFTFTGFADMSLQELIDVTHLPTDSAESAMKREFTEPILWQDTEQAFVEFTKIIAKHGLKAQKGGRFISIMGQDCDKAHAMDWLCEQYSEYYQEKVTSIALGDGGNDVGMIASAGIGIIIRSPVNPPPTIPDRKDIEITEECGPAGWSVAIDQILAERQLI